MEYAQRSLRPVRRPRPVHVKNRSHALRPVAKKSHRGLWIGCLLLLVVGMGTLCLVYMRDAKKEQSAKTYRKYAARAEPTSGLQSSESETAEQETRRLVRKNKQLPPRLSEQMLHEYLDRLNRLGLPQGVLENEKRIIYDEWRR